MSSVLIVYGSTTGNTAAVAEEIGGQLADAGHEVKVLDAAETKPDGLCRGWDAVLFGCSTWGADDVVLQDDFEPLFDAFDRIEAKGCRIACFGTGDSSYPHFCGAVDVIEQKLDELGAVRLVESLKLDGDLTTGQDEVDDWAQKINAAL